MSKARAVAAPPPSEDRPEQEQLIDRCRRITHDIDPEDVRLEDPLRRPDVTLEKEDQVGLVRKALAHLSPTLRGAVALRDVHDLSSEEIAARLQLPEGTVKSRINRGRKELGKHLRALQEPGTVNRGGRADRHAKGQEA